MKILWMKSDFLHPTTRGGQIRTLEMLKALHAQHEVHYLCLDDGTNQEGPERACEYCARAYPIHHVAPPRGTVGFAMQLAAGLVDNLPVAVSRYRSAAMRRKATELMAAHHFDSVVCDFLFPAPNVPDLKNAVLFQHNVEAVIWKRHVQQASNPVARKYLSLQAGRMQHYEKEVCRAAKHVVAVSALDQKIMREEYGIAHVSSVQTGVDIDHFQPPPFTEPKADLIFVGSMDWLPNVDGARFFTTQILPAILARRPDCRIAFAGRKPDPAIQQMADRFPNLTVTGTVPDIRPWLWGSTVSIVPLRIGGGTRLKIYEAMAARIPVVSTAIGAEGLPLENGQHILVEDDPNRFADACLRLLEDHDTRRRIAGAAWSLIASRFSWTAVTREFEETLAANSLQSAASKITYA